LEDYACFLVVYFFTRIIRRKKLPKIILLAEPICLIPGFYCKYLVNKHQVIFIGEYENNPEDWGAG
jgi:hypothetical protein